MLKHKTLDAVIIFLVMLCITKPEQINAGMLKGDEPLGGFSYMMELAYTNTKPKGDYWKLFLLAESMRKDVYRVTDKEYEILCRIVEAEATGGNVEQKMNVASCVLARMESPKWPNDVESVVFDNDGTVWQFSPISDGRYYTVPITSTTIIAVDKVLKDGKTHNCTWFCSDGSYNKKNEKGEYISYHRLHHTYGFFDGKHHYFYD